MALGREGVEETGLGAEEAVGGEVGLSVVVAGGAVVLTVDDSGIGITAEALRARLHRGKASAAPFDSTPSSLSRVTMETFGARWLMISPIAPCSLCSHR